MKYNFKLVMASTLLCLLICCNAEAMHKHNIHHRHNQQLNQYKNTLDFNQINIDMSNKELEKYVYDNRYYNTSIGDKYNHPFVQNYTTLCEIIMSDSKSDFIKQQYKEGKIKDLVNNILREHIRFFNHHSTTKHLLISGYFSQAWRSIWHCIYYDTVNKKQNEKLIERLTTLFQHFMPKLNIDYFKEISMNKW